MRKRRRIDDEQDQQILIDLSFETDVVPENDENDDIQIELSSAQKNEDGTNEELVLSAEENVQKKRNKFQWSIDSEWDDIDKALDYLEDQGFVNYDYSDLKCGLKFYYRCKLVPKRRKLWCSKRHTLYLPSNNSKILILRTEFDHDHEKLLENSIRPPSDEIEAFIKDLFECGTTKVSDIIRNLDYAREKKGLFKSENNPGKRQIEYMLKKFRKTQAPTMVKLGDMTKWCNQNNEKPSDDNEAFVIASEFSTFDENLGFRFAFSTLLLLNILSKCKTICIDATYKLNWLGFPLIVLGTVDRAKHFHPLIYACASHERTLDYEFIFSCVKNAIKTHINKDFEPETLIADGADAIHNAFCNIFESALLIVMCYAHVIRNCRKRPFTCKNNKHLILEDIRSMQLAPNRPTFDMMTKLFCKKWEHVESDFVAYFKKEWLGAHCNWFEGAADYTPSTNNGLESHNATIKKKITLRRRLPMSEFLVSMKAMTADISQSFSQNNRVMATEPDVAKQTFENAIIMVTNNFKAFKAKQKGNSNISIFSVPSSKCADENATEAYYKTLVKTTWDSFDEFIVHGFQQFYIVHFSSTGWKTESTCTCAAFFKQHICKHIVAIGIRLNIIEPPSTANPVRLAATKRKPGRPKGTAKALQIQQ